MVKRTCIFALWSQHHEPFVEDGKFVADEDSGEFWGHFGGYAPLTKKIETKEYEVEAHAGVLFM